MPATDLLTQMKEFLATPQPAGLGPGPRPGVRPLEELKEEIRASLQKTSVTPKRRDLIEATLLLWHDHHDPAHAIVQDSEDSDSSYVHGILHRREPDYGNARYWFRRVGKHPSFEPLKEAASRILAGGGQSGLQATLIVDGVWDAFAFIDACEQVAERDDSDPTTRLLQNIQRAEFEILLARFCSH